jgi:hypothetical protein
VRCRAREARIARLAAALASAESARIDHRSALRATATIGAVVRCALAAKGIDPAIATRLREADAAEAALAAIPDTQELQQADHGYAAGEPDCGPGALDAFVAETRRLATRYEADCEIDLAAAPLADLFAWCLSRRTIELQPSGENLLLISCRFSGADGDDATVR